MPTSAGQLGDSYFAARQQMVRDQMNCGDRSVTDARVLAALAKIPRHEFVPPELRRAAYADRPLPIGHDQTISQPYIVAIMTGLLQLRAADRVLEIGTGCGYQTAVLAELAAAVYSVEIIPALARQAAEVLRRLNYTQVHLRMGDGFQGWPEAAPFSGIILTCAPDQVPPPLFQQLAEGGRLICPVTTGEGQELVLYQKHGGRLGAHSVFPVRFVPMTGQAERR